MLIVDVNTLHTVGPLNLSDEVVMDCLNAENCKDVVRVLSTFGELCALGDSLTLLNLQAEAVGDEVSLLLAVVGGDDNVLALFDLSEGDDAVDLAHDGEHLGLARLKEFFNSGKTGGDIRLVGSAAGVECSHGKLSTRLAYGLSCDDTDSFTDGHRLARCKVCAVALDANAVL